ncbi:hypothetical protein [Sagittula stellata]|uniref:hypothetical protein n=1 Tax=Sagittula stellata TaxID=52603 RepID=UPI0012F4AE61|nr:hypothetical protein [Sagittula stellata]
MRSLFFWFLALGAAVTAVSYQVGNLDLRDQEMASVETTYPTVVVAGVEITLKGRSLFIVQLDPTRLVRQVQIQPIFSGSQPDIEGNWVSLPYLPTNSDTDGLAARDVFSLVCSDSRNKDECNKAFVKELRLSIETLDHSHVKSLQLTRI